MNDIFLSYSSRDSEHALSLVEQLRSSGYEVWIDSSGIDGAMDWSSEIVSAINECRTMLFLISKHSALSHNCAKEIRLASEKNKNILPIILEDVQLPVIFEYPLAGLQRLRYRDTDSIIKTLAKLGGVKTALDAMMALSAKSEEGFLRLAVLPFEDLSPSHDNEWFADGMMDELIGTLGSLSKLVVPGRSSAMVYKKDRPKASVIGEELEVRYIVEGTVRKIGEKIRIFASLTDAKTNTQLWNNKFDGSFDDIFDFQERVSREITTALKIKLTPQDIEKIEQKITENPEAYELYTKAGLYFNRYTKKDLYYALDCLNESVKLDRIFVAAFASIARVHSGLYRDYDRNDSHLTAAAEAIETARKLNPELPIVYHALVSLHLQRGEFEEAIIAAKKTVEIDSKNPQSHGQLGFVYNQLWQTEEAAKHMEESLHLDPTSLTAHYNLCLQYDRLKDIGKRNAAAERALPYFERHVKKNPDGQFQIMNYACFLEFLGRTEESIKIIDDLISAPNADGVTIYNGACLIARQGEHEKALAALIRAVEKGFADHDSFRDDPDLDGLRGMTGFEELMKKLSDT